MDSSDRSVDAFVSGTGKDKDKDKSDQGGMTLPAFLATLSAVLPDPATAPELTAAFAAFDDTDAGQADWGELREALVKEAGESGSRSGDGHYGGHGGNRGGNGGTISTSEIDAVMDMFRGRRAFGEGGRNAGRGKGLGFLTATATAAKSDSVFRYHDFVAAVTGGSSNGGGSGNGNGNGNGNANGNGRGSGTGGATARLRA